MPRLPSLSLPAQRRAPGSRIIGLLAGGAALLIGTVLPAQQPQAASISRIWAFGSATIGDGAQPFGTPMMDAEGRIYGTTYYGGSTSCGTSYEGCGTVFMLAPPAKAGGPWRRSILYRFKDGTDGGNPTSGLVMDAAGALYGATVYGGNTACNSKGCGVIFRLAPDKARTHWTETTLHQFAGGTSDGDYPESALTLGPGGWLYGTTEQGGSGCSACGTAFGLRLPSKGKPLLYAVIHNFAGGANDGYEPYSYASGLAISANGKSLYGTTLYGGSADLGTVFALTVSGGVWHERILHHFMDTYDGKSPYSSVILGPHGRLFGTTGAGGASGYGSVFMLTPVPGNGPWPLTPLKSFTEYAGDVYSGLAQDASGALYGMSYYGGIGACYDTIYGCGTVFKLMPSGSAWKETASYPLNRYDGAFPTDGLMVTPKGTVFGFSAYGGDGCNVSTSGCGTVFTIAP